MFFISRTLFPVKNKIHEQMKQYALCSQDDLNEIQEQLNSMGDAQNLEPQEFRTSG